MCRSASLTTSRRAASGTAGSASLGLSVQRISKFLGRTTKCLYQMPLCSEPVIRAAAFAPASPPRWWLLAVLASLAVSGSAYAQSNPPLHYYDFAIGKTGPALQSIIRNHTVIPCTSTATDIWDAIKVLVKTPANSNNVVLIYSGFTVPKSEQYNGNTGTWDREHLWPQLWH